MKSNVSCVLANRFLVFEVLTSAGKYRFILNLLPSSSFFMIFGVYGHGVE